MYTAKDADEVTKAFIDYMLSDDVQGKLVEDQGFIPLTGAEGPEGRRGQHHQQVARALPSLRDVAARTGRGVPPS